MQTDDIAAPTLDALREKLMHALQDAYAMETHVETLLDAYAKQTEAAPAIQSEILRHLVETRQHRERLDGRLRAFGKEPSAVKDALGSVAGRFAGAVSGMRGDTLARDARDAYVTAHVEIAAYAGLITAARSLGDSETIRACEANLRDEVRMARWLEEHLPEVILLTFARDGIAIPPDVGEEAVATWRAAFQGASWAAQSVVPPGQMGTLGAAEEYQAPPGELGLVPPPEQPTTQATQP